jgi:glycosyltransferase involved in cell wall biosynthesis
MDVPLLPFDAFEEVYAVDGGSTDGTVEYLESMGVPVHGQAKPGLNGAYHQANASSSCDAVVVFFPKGTVSPGSLLFFRPLLEGGCQLVVASRLAKGGRNEEDDGFWRPRKWSVRLLSLLISWLWRREGYRVLDVLHGVKGWHREAFSAMKILDHGLSIDMEMTVRSYKLRLPRDEFPVVESKRSYGESSFPFWLTGKRLFSYLLFELFRKD